MSYAPSWLKLEESLGGMRPVLRGGPQEMRAQVDALTQMLLPLYPPPSENVDVKEGDVEGIGYRLYTPKGNKGGLCLGLWGESVELFSCGGEDRMRPAGK
jgi:versiconal hemiacetal acetate esterase